MGLWVKVAAAAVGLLLIGGPFWPVALISFAYLALSLRPRRTPRAGSPGRGPGGRARYVLALLLFALSVLAYFSGGSLSPVVFSLGGGVALSWPWLASISLAGEVVPARDSIAFRSKYLPFVWHALGEIKPGPDSFPRALSSFSGTLMVFTETGRAYSLVTRLALGRRSAEAELGRQLRTSALRIRSGAFLFPLDSGAACDILRQDYNGVRLPQGDLTSAAAKVSGILALGCAGETVRQAAAYEIRGQGRSAKIPGRGRATARPALVWEVLEEVGKRTRWPDPDPCSSLLDSLNVTRGVPLGERLKSIDGAGDVVSLQSLGGAEVRVTRPQLRALVAIYS